MTISRTIARPMLSSIFLVGPVQTLRNSSGAAAKAESVATPLAQWAQRLGIPLPQDPEKLVKLNAGIQLVAGLALATGRFPRISAAVLATSLVPTTVAGHDFWNEEDPAARKQQQLQLAKNLSLLGGLIIAAGDTDGKPGVAWLAKHAVGDARREVGHMATTAKLETKVAALEAGLGAGSLATAAVAAGRTAKDTIKEAAHQAATADTTQHLGERATDLASTAKEKAPVVAAAALDQIATLAGTARDEAAPVLADLRSHASSNTSDLRKQARKSAKKAAKQARKRAPELAAAAREQAMVLADTARSQAAPALADLRKQAKANAKDFRKQAKKAHKKAQKNLRKRGKQAPALANAAREQAMVVTELAKAKLA